MRRESPAYRMALPNGVEVFAVTRYADIQAALKDERLVKNIRNARPGGPLRRLGIGLNLNNTKTALWPCCRTGSSSSGSNKVRP